MGEKIVLIGAGGHAKSVIDVIENSGVFQVEGFLDPSYLVGTDIYHGYKVLGDDSLLEELYLFGIKYAFITVGYIKRNNMRKVLYEKVTKLGFNVPTIIDESAIISHEVKIEDGSFIGKGAIINTDAKIGKMCIVNSGAIIEHECVIGDYSHVSVGTVICGNVQVGKSTLIGANTTIIQGLKIGENVIIGAGSVIVRTVPDNCMCYGNRKYFEKGYSEDV